MIQGSEALPCELFLTGAAGQKDQQIVPFIFGWVLTPWQACLPVEVLLYDP